MSRPFKGDLPPTLFLFPTLDRLVLSTIRMVSQNLSVYSRCRHLRRSSLPLVTLVVTRMVGEKLLRTFNVCCCSGPAAPLLGGTFQFDFNKSFSTTIRGTTPYIPTKQQQQNERYKTEHCVRRPSPNGERGVYREGTIPANEFVTSPPCSEEQYFTSE